MTPLAKIVVIGAAAGFAYWASRDVETVDGIQRFTEAGAKKAIAALRTTSLDPSLEPSEALAIFHAILGAGQPGFVDTMKFLNGIASEGLTVAVTKSVLRAGAISGGEVLVAVISPADRAGFAGSGEFAVLVN